MSSLETFAKGGQKQAKSWDKSFGLSPVCAFISSIHPVNSDTIEYIEKKLIIVRVAKGKHLIKKGEICNYMYFVTKGVLRGYVKDNEKEITTWITSENELITSISGFHQQTPSVKNIQALENCELLALHYDDLQFLYNYHYEMNIIGRKLLERYFAFAEDRALISRLPQAKDRYKYFLETRSNLIHRVPLKYIASYLAIAEETLSRIRQKMRDTVDNH